MNTDAEKIPAELVESEALVVRQANAIVIVTEDDYRDAGVFLNQTVMPLIRQGEAHFDPKVARLRAAWQAEINDRHSFLDPLVKAATIVKSARAKFIQLRDERIAAERKVLEQAAIAMERQRLQQESAAELQRAAEQAEHVRKEAELESARLEADAERIRNEAAAAVEAAGDGADAEEIQRAADEAAKALELQAAADLEEANRHAAEIAAAGQETAKAISEEPILVDLPTEPAGRLTGTSKKWKCSRTEWDRNAFALWIAGDPEEGSPAYVAALSRAEYIGEPAWTLLDAKANQQQKLFAVGGIKAGLKYSGRAGK